MRVGRKRCSMRERSLPTPSPLFLSRNPAIVAASENSGCISHAGSSSSEVRSACKVVAVIHDNPCQLMNVQCLWHGTTVDSCSIFNKMIDDQGHLDMRNVTTLIWVNRKRPEIVETIVELLIEVLDVS